MKLKFQAEPKDWAFFGIFCVVLLYFVAIAVLNLAQFAASDLDKPFHGFNPFPAFTKDYIGITIVVYIAALVGCIISVSDKFFDRDKGFGIFFSKPKKEKGFSRWATEKEYKELLKKVKVTDNKAEAGGIPLVNDGKYMWVDDGESHSIIIGSTGSGKTQIVVLPLVESLAKNDESMIITDPKGEIYEKTSEMLKEKGYNVVLLNFRNPQEGSGWNPVYLPYEYYKNHNGDKANELIDDLAINILYDQNAQKQDPFWEKTSADYFSGLTLALFEDAKEEEINLNSINLLATVGEERIGPSTYIKKYFETKPPTSPAYVSASSTLIAPNETKGGILAVFKQKLRLFASRENISEMLSHSDFDMKDIGRKKTAVFIIIQDEKKTYHPLVTIFLKQCYETLVDVAQENGGRLQYRTNFILDEFANMPPLKDVETMVSAARSRNMRFNFIIQNFAQLNDVYGKEKGDTIKGNCNNIIYLISSEMAALEEISKMCGEIKVKSGKDGKEKEENRPLVTVSDLQRMGKGEIIVLRTREYPLKVKLKYDYQIDWGYERKKAGYPHRERQEVKVFDLKGFVEAKKAERANSILEKFKNPTPAKTSGLGARAIGSIDDLPSLAPKPVSANPEPKVPTGVSEIDEILKKIDSKMSALKDEANVKKEEPIQTEVKGRSMGMTSSDQSITEDSANEPEPTVKQADLEMKAKETLEKVLPAKEEKIVKKETPKMNVPDLNIVSGEGIPKYEESIITKPKFNMLPEMENTKKELSTEVKEKALPERVDEKERYVTDDQFFDDFFADDDEL